MALKQGIKHDFDNLKLTPIKKTLLKMQAGVVEASSWFYAAAMAQIYNAGITLEQGDSKYFRIPITFFPCQNVCDAIKANVGNEHKISRHQLSKILWNISSDIYCNPQNYNPVRDDIHDILQNESREVISLVIQTARRNIFQTTFKWSGFDSFLNPDISSYNPKSDQFLDAFGSIIGSQR